jgi:transposase InsO family protein
VSSYYYAKKREADPAARETRDAILKDKITEVWKGRKGREVYGARKVWLELNRQGIPVARCTVERLMRGLGIGGVRPRRKRPRTTVPGDPAGRPVGPAAALLRRPGAEPALGGGYHVCDDIFRVGVYVIRDGFVRAPDCRVAGCGSPAFRSCARCA